MREHAQTHRGNGHEAAAEHNSTVGLFRQLADDVVGLFSKEVALAKSELHESIEHTKTGASAVVTGGAVLYAGVLFLMLAATLGLMQVVAPWLAALIVGGVVAIIGFGMVQSGKKKFKARAFTPDKTLNNLQKDRATVKGAMS